MLHQLRIACLMLLILTVLTGLVYPLAITGIAQLVFSHAANGSLIERDGHVVGSELIGQPFDDPKYFWGRPSATSPFSYNAASSSGSNLAIGNPAQLDAIAKRVERLKSFDPENNGPIPADLVTASGSGLDPQISVAGARYQINRVARARKLDVGTVEKLVATATQQRQFGVLGERVVNVLQLNLALDKCGHSPMAQGVVQ